MLHRQHKAVEPCKWTGAVCGVWGVGLSNAKPALCTDSLCFHPLVSRAGSGTCSDLQEYYMHFTVIDAVATTLGVDTVVRKSEYFEHLGSEGSG